MKPSSINTAIIAFSTEQFSFFFYGGMPFILSYCQRINQASLLGINEIIDCQSPDSPFIRCVALMRNGVIDQIFQLNRNS